MGPGSEAGPIVLIAWHCSKEGATSPDRYFMSHLDLQGGSHFRDIPENPRRCPADVLEVLSRDSIKRGVHALPVLLPTVLLFGQGSEYCSEDIRTGGLPLFRSLVPELLKKQNAYL